MAIAITHRNEAYLHRPMDELPCGGRIETWPVFAENAMSRCWVTLATIAYGSMLLSAAAAAPLRAGAAKVDITPSTQDLPAGGSIRDPLYVRAIVVANGKTCAVLVGADQVGLQTPVVQAAIARASKSTGCPPDNFIISATHTHSGTTGAMGIGSDGKPDAQRLEDAIVGAITQAKSSLRAAKVGYGTTGVDLNVNRDLYSNQRWLQAPNRAGSSDKTLAVLEFLGIDDLPIAVYVDYAMHPIDFFLSGVISADFPGEASRYIEKRFGKGMVAVFVQGASGDQNPLYDRSLLKLIGVRTRSPQMADDRIHAPTGWEVAASDPNFFQRATAELGRPMTPDEEPAYDEAFTQASAMVTAMGAVVGEAAIGVMRGQAPQIEDNVSIWGGSESFSCPGRDRLGDSARQGVPASYKDGADVNIRISALRIGDIVLDAVNAEVYNDIAVRLKRESPMAKTMMVTLANGLANSGYIYSNASGDHLTFQVISSRLKPGCAEDKIVSTSLQLLHRSSE